MNEDTSFCSSLTGAASSLSLVATAGSSPNMDAWRFVLPRYNGFDLEILLGTKPSVTTQQAANVVTTRIAFLHAEMAMTITKFTWSGCSDGGWNLLLFVYLKVKDVNSGINWS